MVTGVTSLSSDVSFTQTHSRVLVTGGISDRPNHTAVTGFTPLLIRLIQIVEAIFTRVTALALHVVLTVASPCNQSVSLVRVIITAPTQKGTRRVTVTRFTDG